MDELVIEPIPSVRGKVRVPGSKSLSNRILLLAALAEGTTRIHHLLDSDDVTRMREALTDLGVHTSTDGDSLRVVGRGGPLSLTDDRPRRLHLGNAGTAMRPLAAVLTLGTGHFELAGDARMHERPIGPLVDALRTLGASIDYLGEAGYPPLAIQATGLDGGIVRIDGTLSSQYVSALMMAAPLARAPVTLERIGELVSDPYIEITRRCMALFGVEAAWPVPRRIELPVAPYRSPGELAVEGDASSASYFLAAAAIAGGPVRVLGVGSASMQGDIAFADVLERMGARIDRGPDWMEARRGTLTGIDVDLNAIPDAAMTLAVVALFARGPTRIRGVANWRVKETDRIHAMATELRKLGATVTEHDDGLTIEPPEALRAAEIDTYDDHRMAMCFALSALGPVAVTIRDPECVAKTYPGFFADFLRLAAPAA
ncbi:MAG: 3-phosphoshikimate 1-carboxyvinyltransferase [Pseudomonadales bacterium]|jgi:3-phosphoshikimate 1-carboxyvinyltransferase|nr:3-phosphoshikimate 1-carboxyvinyltransferase [Pseudomonadales bacterium]